MEYQTEETRAERSADDRHVVRLGHDQPEVLSKCKRKEDRQEPEHAVSEGVGRDALALPQPTWRRAPTASKKEITAGFGPAIDESP